MKFFSDKKIYLAYVDKINFQNQKFATSALKTQIFLNRNKISI